MTDESGSSEYELSFSAKMGAILFFYQYIFLQLHFTGGHGSVDAHH